MATTNLLSSLSVRLQSVAIFLSFVGVGFGIKTYLHVKKNWPQSADIFFADLEMQILAALVVNIFVAYILYNITTKPIKKLSETMRAITENKLNIDVPYTHQGTEIGNMARKVQIFKENAIEKNELEAKQKQSEKLIQDEKKKAMEDLAARFESQVQGIIAEVLAEVQNVKTTSEQMSDITGSATKKSSAVATSAETTSHNINIFADAVEQVSLASKEVADKIFKSTESVKNAVAANEGANRIALVLEAATTKIGEIVNLIQTIAGQINLLALNATIESARAGESGKGFAVVANEVKNLASQTSQATNQISSQIVNIQDVSKQVMEALATISNSIKEVDNYSAAIFTAIKQQNAATNEIANNMDNVVTLTNTISTDIVDVSKASGDVSQCSVSVLAAVNKLYKNTDKLNEAMRSFLHDIRAA